MPSPCLPPLFKFNFFISQILLSAQLYLSRKIPSLNILLHTSPGHGRLLPQLWVLLVPYDVVIVALPGYSLEFTLGLSGYELTSAAFANCSGNLPTHSHVALNSVVICGDKATVIEKRIFFPDISDDSSYEIISETAFSGITIFVKIYFCHFTYLTLFFFLLLVFQRLSWDSFEIFPDKRVMFRRVLTYFIFGSRTSVFFFSFTLFSYNNSFLDEMVDMNLNLLPLDVVLVRSVGKWVDNGLIPSRVDDFGHKQSIVDPKIVLIVNMGKQLLPLVAVQGSAALSAMVDLTDRWIFPVEHGIYLWSG